VFYSYADADDAFLAQLEKHLSGLQREQKIAGWHRLHITAGTDRDREAKHHLNAASLILLLISADFLASDYRYEVELQRAMERHDANEARVIPILLRSCDWERSSFARLQMVPRNQKPIASWHSRDEAFTEVAREIRAALDELQRLSFSAPPVELPTIWQVPFQRNPVFTGREDLLHELQELLKTKQTATLSQPQTQAISGLGGVGKTQLAVEYAYRTFSRYQAVFWVNAEAREVLTSGYAGLAVALNLSQKDERDQQVIAQAVKRWLQTHRDWLLVLDNVEDLALLPPLLPEIYGGHILLTTRSQVTGCFAHRLNVSMLTNENGALLLLRRAKVLAEQGLLHEADTESIKQACQISAELGDLPLALDQAGAYIEETECSLTSYRQQYQQRRAKFLAKRGEFSLDYPQPVAPTWFLSFEKLTPLATQVLRLCAFIAPNAIPESLIEYALTSDMFVSEQEPDLDQIISNLLKYSLIQRNPQERTLAVHRLVQAVLRDAMSEEERASGVNKRSHCLGRSCLMSHSRVGQPVKRICLTFRNASHSLPAMIVRSRRRLCAGSEPIC
jgi:hypothetical protein